MNHAHTSWHIVCVFVADLKYCNPEKREKKKLEEVILELSDFDIFFSKGARERPEVPSDKPYGNLEDERAEKTDHRHFEVPL